MASTASKNPILFWEERRAGHGFGMPLSKRIDNIVDRITFALWGVGQDWPD